jgi:type II secretory pathway pseudopilin PulG
MNDTPTARRSPGFSLVEMIVAVGLFTIVMLIAVSALLALIDANRKARTLQSVVNNLNVALDGMVRALRMGVNYQCGGIDPINGGPASCDDGNTYMSFIAFDGDVVIYEWDESVHRVRMSKGGSAPAYLTAPEVDITEMRFYVVGTTPGDGSQPKVVIVMKGTAGAGSTKTRTTFSIQSTAVQRILDI